MSLHPLPSDAHFVGHRTAPSLLARLRACAERSALLCVRTVHAYRLNAVDCDSPLVVLPLQGEKHFRCGAQIGRVGRGELLTIARPLQLDVENRPPPDSLPYVAVVVPFPPEVVESARRLAGVRLGPRDVIPLGVVAVDAFAVSLHDWLDALEAGNPALAAHALAGLLLRLDAAGVPAGLDPPPLQLADRVRTLIAAQPELDWDSARVESALGISGATLRRQLAAEGVGFRIILQDARMSHALGLLQTTRLPVKSVAARAGYASVSSFCRRFQARYGVDPSQVANP